MEVKYHCFCDVNQTNTLKTQTNSIGQIAPPEDLMTDSLFASITLNVYHKYVNQLTKTKPLIIINKKQFSTAIKKKKI